MRTAVTLLLSTASLVIGGCSLIISSTLDGKNAGQGTSVGGAGGQGGGEVASSTAAAGPSNAASSTAASTTAASTTAAQSSSASSGGGCGSGCSLDNAAADCMNGKCVISACDKYFGDCNHDPVDGCEASLKNNSAHCGSCDKGCDQGEKCKNGQCN
jgi:hypothetical protein